MKKFSAIIFFFSVLVSSMTSAQSIREVTISNTQNNELNLYVNYYAFSLGNFISSNIDVVNQDINVELCYFSGVLATSIDLHNDFVIPLSSNGSYNLNLTIYDSTYMDRCEVFNTDFNLSRSFNFPLSQPVTLSNDNVNIVTEIELYPNPTNGIINLSIPASTIIDQIDLFDLTGRKVQIFDPKKLSFNLENLRTGVYVMSISSSGSTFNKKIVLH